MNKTFGRLGKEQNGIYTMFTPIPYVQITNFELIKEAFIEKGMVPFSYFFLINVCFFI